MNITLIVPTYNAGELWKKWIEAYRQQLFKPKQVIIIDSGSIDNTRELAEQEGFFVHKIAKEDFNHGGTRNLASRFALQSSDILVFMTQDALFENPHSLENLLKPFGDNTVAGVCGRQLPHLDANPLAAHARLFNYPSISSSKGLEDIPKYGIKTVFMSNSFSAYRKSIFDELGGFPENTILSEDMYVAAKIVLAGYKVAYCAEATVHHSHNYTLKQEFQRYFDIGVFQANEPWIQEKFGKASSEGKRFIISEILFLWKQSPIWIFKSLLSTFCKLAGFKFGLFWEKLPFSLCIAFSMYKGYWKFKDKS